MIVNNMRINNLKCPECSGNIKQTDNECYCIKCGLVTDDSPLDEDESYYTNGEKKFSRTGPPIKPGQTIGFTNL
jgi:transcription initiation factor TFIIIB Brf1 subunit/transcription initiation factor TFIIB